MMTNKLYYLKDKIMNIYNFTNNFIYKNENIVQ